MSAARCNCPHCGGEIILNVEAVKPLPPPFVYERYLVSIPKSNLIDDNFIMPLPIKPADWQLECIQSKQHTTPTVVFKPLSKLDPRLENIYEAYKIPASEKESGSPTEGGGRIEGNTEAATKGTTSKLWLPNHASSQEATQKTKEEGT